MKTNGILLLVLATLFHETMIHGQPPTQSDFGPRISPNGKEVVFYSYRNDSLPDIFLVDIERRQEVRLTESYHSWDLNPKWSKDGTQIYFSSDRAGGMSIFRMNKDGSNVERVTHPSDGNRHSDLSFTADGSKMLFAEFQPGRKTALILRDLESDQDKVLLESSYEGDEFFKPFIHPEGNEVVFLKNMGNDSTYVFDIFLLDVRSGVVQNLTNSPGFSERMPNWSDDGKYLIWSSDENKDSFDLFKRDRASAATTQVSFFVDRQELNSHLHHKVLVFDAGFYGMSEEGDTVIYMADVDGGNLEQLTGF